MLALTEKGQGGGVNDGVEKKAGFRCYYTCAAEGANRRGTMQHFGVAWCRKLVGGSEADQPL